MGEEKDLMHNLISELRRGTLILSVLSQLSEAKYGYALVQSLEIDPNTLYPLLRRLEKQGILTSQWDVGESKPRKYYSRTPMGDDIFRRLKEQWEQLSENMEQILREEEI